MHILITSLIVWVAIICFAQVAKGLLITIAVLALGYIAYLFTKLGSHNSIPKRVFFPQQSVELPIRECQNQSKYIPFTSANMAENNLQFKITAGQSTKHSKSTAAPRIRSALIVDEPWISLILSGRKTWEMRSTGTTKREQIGLIKKGSKTIVGVVNILDSKGPLDVSALSSNTFLHHVPIEKIGKWNHAWVLGNVIKLKQPVAYLHPPGAVKFVNIDNETALKVLEQI